MSKQFWFPPLPNSEIISSLSAWGVSVSSEQLTKPTSDFVLAVYTFCLQHVTGLNTDELHDVVQQALSDLEDASEMDFYQYALGRSMLYYHMCVGQHYLRVSRRSPCSKETLCRCRKGHRL